MPLNISRKKLPSCLYIDCPDGATITIVTRVEEGLIKMNVEAPRNYRITRREVLSEAELAERGNPYDGAAPDMPGPGGGGADESPEVLAADRHDGIV